MKTYRVTVDRDGRYWHIRVPAVERSTQARHLREIEYMARDLIAIMEDVPADSFDLSINIKLPAEVQHDLDEASALREHAARDQHRAAALARSAARRLYDQGIPLRDIGQMLGISYQRAHQLVGRIRPAS